MADSRDYAIVSFEQCLHASYIDSKMETERSDSSLNPRIIANDKASATNLLSVIKTQLKSCASFDFSVAFISDGGLQALIEVLNELRDKGIPGRFLTSTYLNFNSPAALKKLLEFPNIETRVYQGNMHAKGYFFNKGELSTIIIGSSNCTQTALTCNKEWNVLFHSYASGEMLKSACREFENLWTDPATTGLTATWINEYDRYITKKEPLKPAVRSTFKSGQTVVSTDGESTITPNSMQQHALEALEVLHDRNEQKALLISATGTGKTYLSAFDVLATKPQRVLFLAHRMRILDASRKSFETVLGNRYTYETYGAGSAKPKAQCTFAMVEALRRHIDEFDPTDFDYIIIDEAHRSGADGYRAIMDHFKPVFFLGMTATPERTDGYDVYSLFNHVIAYRITLQDALENDMLSPFHYFGIADLQIDDEIFDDPRLFTMLCSQERALHIAEKIEEYSVDKKNRKGLVFCNKNEEAEALSKELNALGYRTLALSGKDSDKVRDEAILRLENGDIEYILSVNIFNEGIDIPSVNQIIMLRRTESAIVFIQQLGRGLRKTDEKEYTLVLDFIGNYQKNYFIPIALSGDRTYNKDNLRAFVKEGSTIIPGCSTINFDQISEARIFRAIDDGDFNGVKLIREEYEHLKRMLGRIPNLSDYDENEAIDPLRIFAKFGSYHAFLNRYEPEYVISFDSPQCAALKFISQKLANGKRIEELLILRDLVRDSHLPAEGFFCNLQRTTGKSTSRQTIESACRVLSGSFLPSEQPLIEFDGERYLLNTRFASALNQEEFKCQVLEAVDFGISRNASRYGEPYRDTNFVLYEKYTYEDVCRLLNWEKNANGQIISGYKYDKGTNTFPVFINYDKDPSISDTIRYEDRFTSDREIIAISKASRTLQSPEIKRLQAWPDNDMHSYLFIRKNKDDKDGGKEFYFLGEIAPTGNYRLFTMPGTSNSAVEITYRLDQPVRADLYDYLTSDFNQ